MNDIEQIRAVIDQRDASIRHGNAASAVAVMAEGAVVYDLPPPLMTRTRRSWR